MNMKNEWDHIEVSEKELLDNLPLFGLSHLSKEKLKLFVEHMREVLKKRKFESLQNK